MMQWTVSFQSAGVLTFGAFFLSVGWALGCWLTGKIVRVIDLIFGKAAV